MSRSSDPDSDPFHFIANLQLVLKFFLFTTFSEKSIHSYSFSKGSRSSERMSFCREWGVPTEKNLSKY
uniref:Uncharacterized protein n=1 Tax=Leptospira ellisii TaxID=2023197 RepID=A0A2N0BDN2_9LEPT|nr:hypothetical protein CH379_01845 [Leptospira ellisii]